MSLTLHIERLVLDEALLSGERTPAVRAAIEGALGRLLAAPEAAAALRRTGSVASRPPASLPQAHHPKDPLGPRIATAVGQALGVGGPPSSQPHGQRRPSWRSQK